MRVIFMIAVFNLFLLCIFVVSTGLNESNMVIVPEDRGSRGLEACKLVLKLTTYFYTSALTTHKLTHILKKALTIRRRPPTDGLARAFVSTACGTPTARRAAHLLRHTERRILSGPIAPNTFILCLFSPLRDLSNRTSRSILSSYKNVVLWFEIRCLRYFSCNLH